MTKLQKLKHLFRDRYRIIEKEGHKYTVQWRPWWLPWYVLGGYFMYKEDAISAAYRWMRPKPKPTTIWTN